MAEKEYSTFAEALKDVAPNLSEKEREKQLEVIEKAILHGVPMQETLEITPDVMEFIYSQGHRLYMTRQHDEAGRFFHLLYILNPKDARFAFGLAACHHMQKHFEEAVAWYLVAALADPESPLPFYHISDCYLLQDDKETALYFLYKALRRIGDEKKYEPLKERILRTIDSLKKEVEATAVGEKKL